MAGLGCARSQSCFHGPFSNINKSNSRRSSGIFASALRRSRLNDRLAENELCTQLAASTASARVARAWRRVLGFALRPSSISTLRSSARTLRGRSSNRAALVKTAGSRIAGASLRSG